MKIKEITSISERLALINSILKFDSGLTKGEHLMLMALSSKKSAKVIAVFDKGELCGAMSYRVHDGKLKRINTGTFPRKSGYGKAMVNYLKKKYPNKTQWCLSIAPRWCEKIGMIYVAKTKDGRHYFEGFH